MLIIEDDKAIKADEKTAAIILNGTSLPNEIVGDFIVCADGGYRLIAGTGKTCDLLIGDFDSIMLEDCFAAKEVKRFNIDKDMTDGELAVREAAVRGCKRINIYGALGGRPDHVAANLNLLCLADELRCSARIISGFEGSSQTCCIYYVKDNITLETNRNDIISVIPCTVTAKAYASSGLKYPLDKLSFKKYLSLGVSNIATENRVSIFLESGAVFVYRIFNAFEDKNKLR